MARPPSLTREQAESQIGPRGKVRVDSNNRALIKKWLTTHDFPALFTVGLSIIELANAYNHTDGSGLEALRKKLAKGEADGLVDREPIGAGGDGHEPHPAANMDQERVLAAIEDMEAADAKAAGRAPQAVLEPILKEQPKPLPMDLPEQAKPKDAAALLRELLLNGYQAPLDAEAIRKIAAEEVAKGPMAAPNVIHVKHDGKPPIVIEGLQHVMFERIVKYLSARGPNNYQTNILLVGPAGCGKSTLIYQVAKALETEALILAGSGGVTEGDIVGKTLPVDGGAFVYQPSRFVELFERGNATIGLDELFGFDPNCALSLNMPLAGGDMWVQQRRADPKVKRGENVNFIATDNTYGTGANPIFTGRNAGDAATNDRWLTLTVDYDKRIEENIGSAGGLSAAEMASIWEMRDKCRESGIRRFIGTRAFQKASIMKMCGDSWRQVQLTLVEGWTKDEKAKVGIIV